VGPRERLDARSQVVAVVVRDNDDIDLGHGVAESSGRSRAAPRWDGSPTERQPLSGRSASTLATLCVASVRAANARRLQVFPRARTVRTVRRPARCQLMSSVASTYRMSMRAISPVRN
jgi:hypothetical protein